MSERLYYYFWCDTISSEWIYEHILLNVLSRIINNLKVLNVIKINDAIFVLIFEIVKKFYFLILLYDISFIFYTIISPIQFGTNWIIMNTSLQKHSDVWIFYYINAYILSVFQTEIFYADFNELQCLLYHQHVYIYYEDNYNGSCVITCWI